MLSLFKPNRPSSELDESSSSSDEEHIIPPGTPYLTKINGKLVWARKKVPKTINPVQDLMGEAFGGNRAVIVRRRSRSLERPVTRVILGGNPAAQPQQITHSAPLLQQAFPNAMPPMAHCPHHHPPLWSPQFHPYFQFQPMPQPFQHPMQHPVQFPPQGLRLYIPQQPPAPPPLFVQQSPTEKEKEQLKAFDSHFNQTVRPYSTRLASASSEESQEKQKKKPQGKASEKVVEIAAEIGAVKVDIAVTKHICGECGRLRSRKYHHEHPLKPGEVPEIAFCRKCQKYATSTSESSDTEFVGVKSRKEKKDKEGRKGQKEKKARSSADDKDRASELPEAGPLSEPKACQPKLSPPKQATVEQVPTDEYIIVEEEISDHKPQPRGRSKRPVPKEYESRRRPLSPMTSQLSIVRSNSDPYGRPVRRENLRNVEHPVEIHEAFRDKVRRRSPNTQFRFVEVLQDHDEVDGKDLLYPRGVHLVDEAYEKPEGSRQYQKADRAHGRTSPYQAYIVEESESTYGGRRVVSQSSEQDGYEAYEESSRGPPSRHQSFENPNNLSSMVSSEARRRRKRERAPPTDLDSRPWDQPHVIRPEKNDEVIVVTETFLYRKKKLAQDEEERRKQEYIDRATMSPRKTSGFSTEEAADYYSEDWSRPEPEIFLPSIVGKPYQPYQSSKPTKVYRRSRHPDSEPTESEASYDDRESANKFSPQSRPPRSPILRAASNDWTGLNHTDWGDGPLTSSLTKSEHARRRKRVSRSPSRDNSRRRRSTSNGRPAYVRDATDGGTEKALILSPRVQSSRIRNMDDDNYSVSSSSSVTRFMRRENRDDVDDYSVSNMSDAEKDAEVEARHVRFRDTPSLRSARDNWTTSEGQSHGSRSEY
ncbi:uncharacterized protein RSE6_06062 [Rhynchosporium secalis]|uniref:Uncharacterized protein n=1 Tax=Rhynchosporium secalis TaxID=38038 RepID=A0A1E1M9F0_RHYSE|nr:uncharacterized protein RSE6_06062 [Rhynchosporium secalis]